MDQPDSISGEEMTERFVEHFFAPHVYARKLFIPAGMVLVGKIHNHAHLNIMLRGVIKVVTEFGEDIYSGPRIWIGKPGTKRAGLAIEDTEWVTIHPNLSDTQDLAELEEYVIAESYEEFDRLQLGQEV
jgi:hypothetical protein